MFTKLLKNEKAMKIVFFAGIFIIICIFLLNVFSKSSKDEAPIAEPQISADEYADFLENRLKTLLLTINGAGSIDVLITLEKSSEDVYSGKETNVTTTISPVIRGAVVVSSGASNAQVKEKLTEAVSKALGIGVNRICITY